MRVQKWLLAPYIAADPTVITYHLAKAHQEWVVWNRGQLGRGRRWPGGVERGREGGRCGRCPGGGRGSPRAENIWSRLLGPPTETELAGSGRDAEGGGGKLGTDN